MHWPLVQRNQFSNFSWFQLGILGGSAIAIWKFAGSFSIWRRNARIRSLIKTRNHERETALRKLKSVLATNDHKVLEKRKWIINLPTLELANKLKNDELKPIEVLEAFQNAALLAHERTNCVTQFISEAKDWCIELENQYSGSREKPPLYGLPFSVKESIGHSQHYSNPFEVKGYDATAGLSQFLFDPLQNDPILVARLRRLGAVPFALTNVPQTLKAFESSNPIYGTTAHPKCMDRTCGGSSGGEAALMAFRGSPFGIGNDAAGSLRMPAHFCGVYTLKACNARLSVSGGRSLFPGRYMASSGAGPFANDVQTLVLFMSEVLKDDFFNTDTYLVPVPFRMHLYESEKPLTIGYYDYDGFIEAIPACKRAVHVAKGVLEKRGHKLVKFQPPDMNTFYEMAANLYWADGGHRFCQILSNEIIDPTFTNSYRWYKLPIAVQKSISMAAKLIGQPKLSKGLEPLNTRTRDLSCTLDSMMQYKTRFSNEWKRLNLDAVICPVGVTVATPHYQSQKIKPAFTYTLLYNVLDYAAGVVPVTQVTTQDEHELSSNYETKEYYANLIKQYNGKGTVGLPVGVQCVATTYNEEICLRLMHEIEQGMKDH